MLHNYTWLNSKISFDNVGIAYLALFQVVSLFVVFIIIIEKMYSCYIVIELMILIFSLKYSYIF